MLNFDEARFRSIQSGAVGLAGEIELAVDELLGNGYENLHFLGAGGAGVLMLPAAQLLQRMSSLPTFLLQPAEMMALGSVSLGARSIVVLPSLSGTTPETIEVLRYAAARGARVISLTGHADSPVAQAADVNFTNFAEDDTSSESFYLQSLLLARAVLEARGELTGFDGGFGGIVAELGLLPELLLEAKRAFEPRAAELAAALRDEPYHIITGAGGTWAQAWYYGTCILEEMQWIRTRPIHAADFFHGTLELVEPGVSVMLFMGEDAARPLVERVGRFVPTVTDKVTVLDSAVFALPGISDAVRGLISQVLIATLTERLSAHLEVLRGHPLTKRRYYRRVDY
ncbi:MAG: SIS domain-containing protein [Acidobacteriota bacterium]|nr:SIS domain-containing protein [Acidobacteriota bacterium]